MNLELTESDFNDCILDTYGDEKRDMDVMASYPLLSKLDGFEYDFSEWDDPEKDKSKAIKFINYFYSRNTILEQKYTEYRTRKAACAFCAGYYYDPANGSFQSHVEEMLQGKNPNINRMIISFLRQNFNDKFTTLSYIRDTFYTKLSSEKEMDVIDINRLIEVESKMAKLGKDLLCGDETPLISMALLQKFEEISLDLKPEDIAQKIRDGKSPVTIDPYKK